MADKVLASRIAGDLLVVFEVALRERCMHRSAVRLGLTELDVRSALAQLDATLGEPLFSISGSSLTPTSCARRLALDLNDGHEPEAK